jgi:hypothetical protein
LKKEFTSGVAALRCFGIPDNFEFPGNSSDDSVENGRVREKGIFAVL